MRSAYPIDTPDGELSIYGDVGTICTFRRVHQLCVHTAALPCAGAAAHRGGSGSGTACARNELAPQPHTLSLSFSMAFRFAWQSECHRNEPGSVLSPWFSIADATGDAGSPDQKMLISLYFTLSATNQLRSAAWPAARCVYFFNQISSCKDPNWINVLGCCGNRRRQSPRSPAFDMSAQPSDVKMHAVCADAQTAKFHVPQADVNMILAPGGAQGVEHPASSKLPESPVPDNMNGDL